MEMKNDTEQKGFVVYGDYKAVIDELDDEQVGKLFRGMLNYFVDGEDPNFTDVLKFVFIPIKQQMDRDGCKYQKKCERNRANINKRWGKNNTTVYDGIRTYTNDTNTKTKSNTNTNIKRERNFVPPTLDEVKAYCNEKGYRINPERFVAFYASKGWKVGNQSMKDWKAAVVSWEQRRKEEAVPANQDSNSDMGDIFSKALNKMKEHRE